MVNYHDGVETDEYLEITVSGVSSPQADVSVNGVPARNFDRNFSAKIRLKDKVNRIVAVAEDAYGEYTQTITVIWDKKSFKRYNFFIDDCLFCANLSC